MQSKRPALLAHCPLGLRMILFHRLGRWWIGKRSTRYAALFQDAPLAFRSGLRMTLNPDCLIHQSIAFTGCYELSLSRRLLRHARQGGVLVDVGANYGYFALLWAAQRPGNRVFAFEAGPRNHRPLQHNVSRNKLDDRITVFNLAASREPGVLAFEQGPQDQTGWGGLSLEPTTGSVLVQVVRLDDVLPADPFIDVLKIDTEGADAWVLQGAERLLRDRRVGTIFFEENPARAEALGSSRGEAVRYLSGRGYVCRPLTRPRDNFAEYEARPG